HRHHAAREIERDFIQLCEVVDAQLAMQIRVLEYSAVENVFQASLKMTDEIGVTQHLFVLILKNVAIDFQNDTINRKRARLVGAQHVHTAEVLDRVKSLHDDFFP